MPYDENTPGDKIFTVSDFEQSLFYIRDNYSEYIKKYIGKYRNVNSKMNKYLEEPYYDDILKFWRK